MKFLWVIACVLTGLDMASVAAGVEPSVIVSPDWAWLAWLPTAGWFLAAYAAATARAERVKP